MKQSVQLNKDKNGVSFTWSRVIHLRDMQEGRLLRILDALDLNAGEAFAIVQETLEKLHGGRRPHTVLKAVMLPKALWDSTMAANPSAVLTLTEIPVIDDFLYLQDRVARVIPRLAPVQGKRPFSAVVPAGLVVSLGYSFVNSAINSTPTAASYEGDAGTLTFASSNIGATVTGTAITQPHYTVIRIERNNAQRNGQHLSEVAAHQRPWGVLIHPNLATALGVSLPSF